MPNAKAIDDAAQAAAARAQEAMDRVANQADGAIKALPGITRDAQKKLKDGVDQVRSQVSDLGLDDLNERFDDARGYVVDRVQDRPVTATLAALGAGFLIGLLLAGNRR